MPTPVNPYMLVEWDKPTPGDGVDFVRYNIGLGDPADGYRIGTVDDIDIESYAYHEAPPGLATYWASWTGDMSGALIESERVSATSTLAFERGWLHDTGDPTASLRVVVERQVVGREQGISYQRRGGEAAPTPFVRRARARRWQLQLVSNQIADGTTWRAIEALQDRQYDHAAILCLRLGFRAGERYFVTIGDLDASLETGIERPSFTAQEVAYREDV